MPTEAIIDLLISLLIEDIQQVAGALHIGPGVQYAAIKGRIEELARKRGLGPEAAIYCDTILKEKLGI